MSATKDFVVFDGDSHVVEPAALWEEYLDPEYRTLGKHALWRQEGGPGAYLKVNGEIFRDRSNPNLPRHALWRPGMTWEAIGNSIRTRSIRPPRALRTRRGGFPIWTRWASTRRCSIRPGSLRASS